MFPCAARCSDTTPTVSLLVSIAFPAATSLPSTHAIYLVTGGAGIAVALLWVRSLRISALPVAGGR